MTDSSHLSVQQQDFCWHFYSLISHLLFFFIFVINFHLLLFYSKITLIHSFFYKITELSLDPWTSSVFCWKLFPLLLLTFRVMTTHFGIQVSVYHRVLCECESVWVDLHVTVLLFVRVLITELSFKWQIMAFTSLLHCSLRCLFFLIYIYINKNVTCCASVLFQTLPLAGVTRPPPPRSALEGRWLRLCPWGPKRLQVVLPWWANCALQNEAWWRYVRGTLEWLTK